VTLPEYLYQYVGPFMLLLARVGGLFIFAPVLSSQMMPARVKTFFVFMMTLVMFPLAGPIAAPPPDIISLAVTIAAEAMIGLTLGLIAALPLYAAQLGGQMMDHQIGLGLASVYNPALDTEGTVLSDMILNISVAIFISLGGLDAVFLGVVRSLSVTPLGAASIFNSPLDLLVSIVASGFELALRIAAPVLGVITLETVAAAVISKTMPQINILSIGFAVKIIAGLTTLIAALSPINGAIADVINTNITTMLDWASSR
jgi:flagellar biosynthetic protein FliR